MGSISNDSQFHVVLFPFMSKGHTIPLLHFARLLLHRNIAVTIFTTPANRPFISNSVNDTTATIIALPFPDNIPEVPSGIESTDQLPSMSLFPLFALAAKAMQVDFEQAIKRLPVEVNFMVSDAFLWWTLESANKFGIPRLVFYGMSNYAMSISRSVAKTRLLFGSESDDELLCVTTFPWINVTRNDFCPPFTDPEPEGPIFEFVMKAIMATSASYGIVVNSFCELEPVFLDFWNNNCNPKAWCVGPLCLAEPKIIEPEPTKKPSWIQWLDRKCDQESSVLYVAFGSQAEISSEQVKEIARGLEDSNVNFLWVIRKKESGLGEGFEERVKERGLVVREWVDQREILMHQSVQGFLSHCGWNSVLESICAGVPILAWPMLAEQPLNARMLVEEIKVGLRVETCNGSVRGFVKSEGLEKMIRQLMKGETGKEVRKRVKEISEMAKKAMEGTAGSSWCTLEMLINETCHGMKM